MLLLIDACAREHSRTRYLAQRLLARFPAEEVQTVALYALGLRPLDEYGTLHRDPALARQFARADTVVIAAPYWDLSFPSVLKVYIEHICVLDTTFRYTEENVPVSLCRARRLYYVTTAGGPILDPAPGYGYVETVMRTFFGIRESRCFAAENLDLPQTDVDAALRAVCEEIDAVPMGGADDAR